MMALLGEGLHDDALRCRVHTRIGNRIKPIPQLTVKVVEVAKRTCQEEVFPDIAEWSLDLSFGLGAIGFAGLWMKTLMAGKIEQSAVIDNAPGFPFADDGSLHSVVENLAWNTANCIERGDMASQHRRKILMHGEAAPYETAVAQHHGKELDDPRR